MEKRNKPRFLNWTCSGLILSLFFSSSAWATPPELWPPSEVNRIYLFGDVREPQKGLALIQAWFDAYRDDPAHQNSLSYEYASATRAYQSVGETDAAVQFLKNELGLAKNVKTIYLLNKNLAQLHVREERFEEAVQYWKAAQSSMMAGTHPYFTTRQALPLFEIGKIYLSMGETDRAREYFESYRQSSYGNEHDNGVVDYLGDLYKLGGEWEKARELYRHYLSVYRSQHWANQTYKKNMLQKLETLLAGSTPDSQQKATALAQQLTSEEWQLRRSALIQLQRLFAQTGTAKDWRIWLEVFLRENPHPLVEQAMLPLKQYLNPPQILGPDQADRPADFEELRAAEGTFAVYKDLLEVLLDDKSIRPHIENLQWGWQAGPQLGRLCENAAYRERLRQRYTMIRENILNLTHAQQLPESLSRLRSEQTMDDIRPLLVKNPELKDLLKTIISLEHPFSGQAVLLLYSLGDKADIAFIIHHIPPAAYRRNYMFWPLAAQLYRDGTVDIPEVLRVGHAPYLDWWNVALDGQQVKERFQQWWQNEEKTFSYTQVKRPGKLLAAASPLMGLTAIAAAPEMNGFFWLEEGGRDYSASIHYFSFADETSYDVLSGGYDGGVGRYRAPGGQWSYSSDGDSRIGSITGLDWNSKEQRLEFAIGSVGSFGAFFEGEKLTRITPIGDQAGGPKTIYLSSIQNYGDQTFELRGGDLFWVQEKTGEEKALLTYGYALSFILSQDLKKAVVVDRDILGQSLWLIHFQE